MRESIKEIFEKIKNNEVLNKRELNVVYVALRGYDAFDAGLNEVLGISNES